MNILRTFFIGLAGFICISAISGFVYLLTFQTTLMDRAVVKGWLSESKIYEGGLLSALVQTGEAQTDPAAVQTAMTLSPEVLKNSIDATFTPNFTQTQLESIVDSAYDWIDGKKPTFEFSVPVDQQRDTFVQQLAKGLEPQIASLPICQSLSLTVQTVCRPSTFTVEQFANQVATQSIAGSGVFTEPITNESFAQSAAQTGQPLDDSPLAQLPAIKKVVDLFLILLPIIAILSGTAIILASTGRRISTSARLARRILFSMLFILIPAAIIAWLASSNNFSLSSVFPAQTSAPFIPLVKTILVGILGQLALISGIGAAVSTAAWLALHLWQKKRPTSTPVTLQS